MNPEYIVFCVAIITLIVYLYLTAYSPSLIYVRSTEDNKLHLVQNKPDKVDAANLFAEIKRRNRELVKKFVEKFGDKDGRVNTLAKRYKSDNIREAVPKVNQTSYSLNFFHPLELGGKLLLIACGGGVLFSLFGVSF